MLRGGNPAANLPLKKSTSSGAQVFGEVEEYRLPLFRQSYAGQTDAERWCRKVIAYMRDLSRAHTDGASRADQLEADLSRHLAQGPLQLPD
jgi:hypothetical protein